MYNNKISFAYIMYLAGCVALGTIIGRILADFIN